MADNFPSADMVDAAGRRPRSAECVREILLQADARGEAPAAIGYHRVDGPGSSLSLTPFQLAMYRRPAIPDDLTRDPSWRWSDGLSRTVAWTITTGTEVSAHPYVPGKVAMDELSTGSPGRVEGTVGEIPPSRATWILKMMEAAGLDGVLFSFRDLDPRTRAGGLGGSATAATAAILLADHLTGGGMRAWQIAAVASSYENQLGVSITGTQEQWNVLAGGITDYVWLPWGRAAEGTGYGDALRRPLLPLGAAQELVSRCLLVRAGGQRASADVNRVWLRRLQTDDGFRLHRLKPGIAYQYAESLRNRDWDSVTRVMGSYRALRTRLCPSYMDGAWWLQSMATEYDASVFPLGAGGGGFALVWSASPESIRSVRRVISDLSPERILDFEIRDRGHELVNPVREVASGPPGPFTN